MAVDVTAAIASFNRARRERRGIAMLTAYDYPLARLLEEAEIDILLVGDSLGMVVLGFPDTTQVTMEHMLHHTAAVARGAISTFIISDLPANSYLTPEAALANAQRLLDAGAHAVKMEGGAETAPRVQAVVQKGIPVMSHIGMQPQAMKVQPGAKMRAITRGSTPEEAAQLREDARVLVQAGAFALLLEMVDEQVAAAITNEGGVPTIGIGSGRACDGQVLVTHDIIGLFPWFKPKFVTRQGDVAWEIKKAAAAFRAETRDRL